MLVALFCAIRSRSVTKVAIVDDHEALREGLEHLLEARGVEVVGTAGSAAAADDVLERGQPDVAVIDIALPDGSGIDLTKRLLARHPTLGVVIYTGSADAELLYGGLDSGARGYALKAGSMAELVAAIERVAAGGTYVDPRLDRVLLSERSTQRIPQLSARERILVHRAVSLHVAPDLQRRHRPALRHEVRDQGELANELLRVLGHPRTR